jgi:hypothetical protein
MVFKPGQSGNPGGRSHEKEFASALRVALNQVDTKKGRKKLLLVVEKLVDCAVDGESWAVCQVADRLDGKPAQESTLNVNTKSITELTDAEIAARLAALRARGAGVTDGDGEPSLDTSQLN